MSTTAFTLRLQSELCALVSLDADTYLYEPERFLPGQGRRLNPMYVQMRERRRRIEQLRQQLQESMYSTSRFSTGRSVAKVAA
jgi:hypothetical protein